MPVFCQKCGHRNASDSFFCSSCGSTLEVDGDKTVVIAKVDQLQDALGPQDNASIDLRTLPQSSATLMVRSGPQAGARFVLTTSMTVKSVVIAMRAIRSFVAHADQHLRLTATRLS